MIFSPRATPMMSSSAPLKTTTTLTLYTRYHFISCPYSTPNKLNLNKRPHPQHGYH